MIIKIKRSLKKMISSHRVSDFKKQMAAVPEFYQAYVTGNRSQFLQDLIDRELIYQKARHSHRVRNRDIKKRLAELEKDFLVQDYVQKEIRYIAVKVGVASGWGGYDANLTWKRRYGCCIDKALLLTTMLKAAIKKAKTP